MSAQTSYVYIPNLNGGQMLRIPLASDLEDDYEQEQQPIPSPSSLTINTTDLPIPTRDASPTRSVESMESVEETE